MKEALTKPKIHTTPSSIFHQYQANLKEKYQKVRKIGEGGFGKVYIIEDKTTHDLYVAKISKFSLQTPNITESYREIDIHCQIEHPCISQLIGYSFTNFQNKECITLLMKYYEHGSLKQFLHENSNLTSNDNTTVQIIITQIEELKFSSRKL